MRYKRSAQCVLGNMYSIPNAVMDSFTVVSNYTFRFKAHHRETSILACVPMLASKPSASGQLISVNIPIETWESPPFETFKQTSTRKPTTRHPSTQLNFRYAAGN
ncbi:hypothetical protein PMIN04_000321 [Paraphaeosphaeria minitans]